MKEEEEVTPKFQKRTDDSKATLDLDARVDLALAELVSALWRLDAALENMWTKPVTR